MTTSNPPPAPNVPYSIPPKGGNGFAVASLVFSLIGLCVPFVGGILGIILGMLGLRRSRETGAGSGLATAGIIVGVVSLLTSCVVAFIGWGAYFGVKAVTKMSEAPRAVARQYITDLSRGNIDAAEAESSGISRDELTAESATLKPLGNFVDNTSNNINFNNNVLSLSGTATFAGGTKGYTITVTQSGTAWKVTSASFP